MERLKRAVSTSIRRRVKSLLLRSGFFPLGPRGRVRDYLSHKYIQGSGIEIGGLHRPLDVPKGTHVRYVDRLTVRGQRVHYPELRGLPLVDVDIVDDGERLARVADASQDFVIANHFLEHCQNPIGALENMLRVLQANGILYMAIPDKRHTFDRNRPVTTHLYLFGASC